MQVVHIIMRPIKFKMKLKLTRIEVENILLEWVNNKYPNSFNEVEMSLYDDEIIFSYNETKTMKKSDIFKKNR